MEDRPQGINVIDGAFERICDFEELYRCYLDARRQKRYRDDIMEFTDRLEPNLFEIKRELETQTYEVGEYHTFFIHDPKTRLIMSLKFKDRIVQWAVYHELMPIYDKIFIDDSCACRKGKGIHAAVDRLQYWLRKVSRQSDKQYFMKLDISKYFYRIDHAVLLDILRQRIADNRLMRLLEKIIDNNNMRFGLPQGKSPDDCTEEDRLSDRGMPIGNLTSQLFANIYLNELDQYCKHILKIKMYVRYVDDMIIIGEKKELALLRDSIRLFLQEHLHLDLNERKTVIRPVSMGIEFVGYRVWATHRKLKKQTARRCIRRAKLLCKGLNDNENGRKKYQRVMTSYKGLLQHCDSYGLRRKLKDIYIQEAANENSGKERRAKDKWTHLSQERNMRNSAER